MKKSTRKARPAGAWEFQDYTAREKRSFFSEYGPMGVGGAMLVLTFAFAGHYMGQNAVAHNAEPGEIVIRLDGARNMATPPKPAPAPAAPAQARR